MSLTITHDIDPFANAMVRAAGQVDAVMLRANQQIIAFGIATAQGNAPRMDGILAGSIQQIGGVTPSGGEFGTSLIYAWMREEGGTIHGNPFLVFPGRNGGLVFARSVTQTGTKYMARSARELEPFAMAAWGKAIERVWDGV